MTIHQDAGAGRTQPGAWRMIKDFWRADYPSTAVPLHIGAGKNVRIRQYDGGPWLRRLQFHRDAGRFLDQGYHIVSQVLLSGDHGGEWDALIVTYCLTP